MEIRLLVQLHNCYQGLICTEEAAEKEPFGYIKEESTDHSIPEMFSSTPKCLDLKKKQNFVSCRKLQLFLPRVYVVFDLPFIHWLERTLGIW